MTLPGLHEVGDKTLTCTLTFKTTISKLVGANTIRYVSPVINIVGKLWADTKGFDWLFKFYLRLNNI